MQIYDIYLYLQVFIGWRKNQTYYLLHTHTETEAILKNNEEFFSVVAVTYI